MSVKNHKLLNFSTQNRSSFLYVDGSTAWIYDCRHQSLPLYVAEQCYDKISAIYLDTAMHVDTITRQTFEYANHLPCENTHKMLLL